MRNRGGVEICNTYGQLNLHTPPASIHFDFETLPAAKHSHLTLTKNVI